MAPIRTDLVAKTLSASDAELFADLGSRAYISEGRLIHKRSVQDPNDEENGKKIFAFILPELRRVICDDWQACRRMNKYPDELALVVAISDTIVTTKVIPLPAVTLAVLAVRIGVKRLCNCHGS